MKTLVVGGTGMLTGVVHSLVDAGDDVYVLSRTSHPELDGATHLTADYRDTEELGRVLGEHAPFERGVVWTHSDAPEAPGEIARHVTGPYFWVRSSAAAEPNVEVSTGQEPTEDTAHLHEIILGFVREGPGSRWLTHAEICDGVLAAMTLPAARHVVGIVSPWSARPGS